MCGRDSSETPPDEVLQTRTDGARLVSLLLYEGHYVLIYNFNATGAADRGEAPSIPRYARLCNLQVDFSSLS